MSNIFKWLYPGRFIRIFLLIISLLWIILLPYLWNGGLSGADIAEERNLSVKWGESSDLSGPTPDFRQIAEALTEFKRRAPELSDRDLTPLYRIFKLAAGRTDMAADREKREQFIAAHGTACALLLASGEIAAADDYVDELEAAAGDETLWRAVWNNPPVLAVAPLLKWENSDLTGFFLSESSWLAEALAWQDLPENSAEKLNTVINYITVARRSHPVLKRLFYDLRDNNPELLSEIFFLGENFGDTLSLLSGYNVPLGESAAVLAASPSIMNYRTQNETVNLLAAAHHSDKVVWRQLQTIPEFFTLYVLAPEDAESLLSRYGDDLPGFIVNRYSDAVPYAANAIGKSGDCAIIILESYHTLPAMSEYLKRPDLRNRLIPFIAKFGDKAFAMLAENPRWAERYFLADGSPNPADTTVIDMLPVIGAPYTLGKNLFLGYPSTWGEVGWAALDIADGVLLVASLGTSAPASAAKSAAKSSLKSVEKGLTRIPLKQAGREILSSAAEQSWRGVLKKSARLGRNLTIQGGKTLLSTARKTVSVWHSAPPSVRKWSYRAMLGAGLYITITERSAGQYPEAMANLSRTFDTFNDSMLSRLNSAMQDAATAIVDAYMPRSPWLRRLFAISGSLLLLAAGSLALKRHEKRE